MKILSFSYTDKTRNWSIEEINLNTITLLVGASGVGKTEILRALINIKSIAAGKLKENIKWQLCFNTVDENRYVWEGEFNKPALLATLTIKSEKLFLNNNLIVDRDTEKILFNNAPTPKLPSYESILNLLKEEDLIKPAYDAMQSIHFSSQFGFAENKGLSIDNFSSEVLSKYNSLQAIRASSFKASIKLYLLSQVDKGAFDEIKQRFIDIFPNIEDIGFSISDESDAFLPREEQSLSLKVKEKNVKQWIYFPHISWGMIRSLKHLSEIYLCKEGTVFLIDEFENSLGINCINEITDNLLNSGRQLQFIVTSHHPYSIHFKHWKIVTRNGGIVKTHEPEKFHIGKSRHDAFTQLLQLEEYQTGEEE